MRLLSVSEGVLARDGKGDLEYAKKYAVKATEFAPWDKKNRFALVYVQKLE